MRELNIIDIALVTLDKGKIALKSFEIVSWEDSNSGLSTPWQSDELVIAIDTVCVIGNGRRDSFKLFLSKSKVSLVIFEPGGSLCFNHIVYL